LRFLPFPQPPESFPPLSSSIRPPLGLTASPRPGPPPPFLLQKPSLQDGPQPPSLGDFPLSCSSKVPWAPLLLSPVFGRYSGRFSAQEASQAFPRHWAWVYRIATTLCRVIPEGVPSPPFFFIQISSFFFPASLYHS